MGEATVLACVDRSHYLSSVCDHAAWIASRAGAAVEVLSAREEAPGPRGSMALTRRGSDPTVSAAMERLVENGADICDALLADGPFASLAVKYAAEACYLVLGRRGEVTEAQRGGFGKNLRPILEQARCAVCIAPALHLPPSRALVLFDQRRPAPGFAEFLAADQTLDGLTLDAVTVVSGAQTPEPVVNPTLTIGDTLCASTAHEALTSYFDNSRCDLIVMPRSILLDPPEGVSAFVRRLAQWRIPILCPSLNPGDPGPPPAHARR